MHDLNYPGIFFDYEDSCDDSPNIHHTQVRFISSCCKIFQKNFKHNSYDGLSSEYFTNGH